MSTRVIDIVAAEKLEKVCNKCGCTTRFHSIDGGMTSAFICSECGHRWSISPFGREEDAAS